MESDSPGRVSSEEDIEMISLPDVVERERRQEYGHTKDAYAEEDEEPEGDERALLSGAIQTELTRETHISTGRKVWPQIKGIVVESAPTLLMTAVSLLFTGKLLDTVSHWRAMREVDQLIMLIPTLLNLNGNLEMNLAARLGTAANVGELDDPAIQRAMIIGSLTLLQVQAICVSFVASMVALLLGRYVPRTSTPTTPPTATPSNSTVVRELLIHSLQSRQSGDLPRKSGLPTFFMICSTAMSAAALSSLILGSLMCILVVVCRKYGRDPDNIAPAIASCLGDLFTLILTGVVSNLLIPFLHTPIPLILAIAVVCFGAGCLAYTLKSDVVRHLLKEGWSPLFIAMCISIGTGIVLDTFVSRYEGFAILAIVISGLPGAAGSILVSRLSTALHAAALAAKQTLPPYSTPFKHPVPSPALTTMTLLVVTLPVEVIFLSILNAFGWLNLHVLFVAFSIMFFCCAVLVSLTFARLLTNFLWAMKRDPDMYALPIHSALMDLVGQLLLVLCFEIVSRLGGKVRTRS